MAALLPAAGTLDAEVGFYSSVLGTRPSRDISLAEFLNQVRSPKWKTPVEFGRELLAKGDTDGFKRAKRERLPAVTLSGTSEGRAASDSAKDRKHKHSGWLQVDLDAKDHPNLSLEEMRERLISDPHIGFVFLSPSGKGLKAGIRIPASLGLHQAAFAAAEAHLAAQGLKMDKATKDPLRLCYVSHDPDAWVNEGEFIELDLGDRHAAEARFSRHRQETGDHPALDVERVRDLLSVIPARPEYNTWIRIVSAVLCEIGEEEGIPLLKAWSPEEEEGEYERQARSPLTEITGGTLVHIAKKHGWTGGTPVEDIWYYPAKNCYYVRDGIRWIPYKVRNHVLNRLARGVHKATSAADRKRKASAALQRIEEAQTIDWAGPIAGYPPGPISEGQTRLLITEGPQLVQPSAGGWTILEAVLKAILGDDPDVGEVQLAFFHAWVKQSVAAIRSGVRTPGYLLAIVGAPESGKSLLVSIIQQLFGGRVAMPHQAWSKDTGFNADLAGAELLVMDDCHSSGEMVRRRALATSIKENLFADTVRIHPKGREAFVARPVWRAVMCCNDDQDSLYVLPPLSDDMVDKIMLLRCHKREMPLPASTPEQRRKFKEHITQELPAYLDYLGGLELGPEIAATNRCGFKPFHHPAIRDLLTNLSPESQFLEAIDYLFDSRETGDHPGYTITYTPLERVWTAADLLSRMGSLGGLPPHMVRGLPNSPHKVGRYLMALSKSHPHRIREATMRNGIQRWEIEPPSSAIKDRP
jgi:hypothetical protein